MSTGHRSIFSYSLSRPYPYRWFTPVVIVGFIVAAALFSFLNFASNGYDLIVQSSQDANATESNGTFFKDWPAYLTSKIQPQCQTTDIRVNSRFFTNQTALTYTLTEVWQNGTGDGNRTVFPSLTYKNNVLEECRVTSIDMDISSDERTANQIAYSVWGVTAHAHIVCQIQTSAGTVGINLTTEYNYAPASGALPVLFHGTFFGTGFVNRDPHARASLYWGESLMSMNWALLTTQSSDDFFKNAFDDPAQKGSLAFTPNQTASSNISSLDFFQADYHIISRTGKGITFWVPTNDTDRQIAYLNSTYRPSRFWINADNLAKSMHSTILTDLGQAIGPNILTDPALLQQFTANFTDQRKDLGGASGGASIGPMTQDYNTLGKDTGPLGVTPSVISTTYICQVPRLKSTGNIVLSILIADLVFLQLLWKVFTLAVESFLLRKRPGAQTCEEHLDEAGGLVVPMRDIGKRSSRAEDSLESGLHSRGRSDESLSGRGNGPGSDVPTLEENRGGHPADERASSQRPLLET